jgi:hypothetical protein
MADRNLRAAYLSAVAAIEAETNPLVAFHMATQLREESDEIVGEAAGLRARMAYRVWQAEGMSISQLAARLGTSKARAAQLLRAGKAGE